MKETLRLHKNYLLENDVCFGIDYSREFRILRMVSDYVASSFAPRTQDKGFSLKIEAVWRSLIDKWYFGSFLVTYDRDYCMRRLEGTDLSLYKPMVQAEFYVRESSGIYRNLSDVSSQARILYSEVQDFFAVDGFQRFSFILDELTSKHWQGIEDWIAKLDASNQDRGYFCAFNQGCLKNGKIELDKLDEHLDILGKELAKLAQEMSFFGCAPEDFQIIRIYKK